MSTLGCLDEDELVATLTVWNGLIDFAQWGQRGRIYSTIVAEVLRTGAPTPARLDDLAEMLAMDRRHAQRHLRSMLVDERSLERDLPAGARSGRRAPLWWPNVWFPDWLGVPLVIPREVALGRAGFQRGLDGFVMARATRAPQSPEKARATRAPFSDAVDRKRRDMLARHFWGDKAREGSAPLALGPAREGDALLSNVVDGTHLFPGVPSELSTDERERAQRVMRAICEARPDRDGRPGRIWGRAAQTVTELVRRASVDDLLAAIDDAAPELGIPGVVGHLENVLMFGEGTGSNAGRSRASLHARAAALRRHIAAYENDGGDAPQSLVDELRECDTALGDEAEEATG